MYAASPAVQSRRPKPKSDLLEKASKEVGFGLTPLSAPGPFLKLKFHKSTSAGEYYGGGTKTFELQVKTYEGNDSRQDMFECVCRALRQTRTP